VKNIVTYIDESAYASAYLDALNKELGPEDMLIILYKMPSLRLEAMPMIGDLHELRIKKANKMIQLWSDQVSGAKRKKIYIFENRISLKDIKEEIDFSINSIVFHTPTQSKIIKSLFSSNGDLKSLQFKEIPTNIKKD
jgi:hypothetical protein